MEKKKRQRGAYALLFLLGVALAAFLLRPAYLRYLEADHAATCANARAHLVRRMQENWVSPEKMKETLEEVLREDADIFPEGMVWDEATEGVILIGACLSGGTYHITGENTEEAPLTITCHRHP